MIARRDRGRLGVTGATLSMDRPVSLLTADEVICRLAMARLVLRAHRGVRRGCRARVPTGTMLRLIAVMLRPASRTAVVNGAPSMTQVSARGPMAWRRRRLTTWICEEKNDYNPVMQGDNQSAAAASEEAAIEKHLTEATRDRQPWPAPQRLARVSSRDRHHGRHLRSDPPRPPEQASEVMDVFGPLTRSLKSRPPCSLQGGSTRHLGGSIAT